MARCDGFKPTGEPCERIVKASRPIVSRMIPTVRSSVNAALQKLTRVAAARSYGASRSNSKTSPRVCSKAAYTEVMLWPSTRY